MAKNSNKIGSKQFFTIVVASVAALAVILLTTVLVQKPTNTESHAAYNPKLCNIPPKWELEGSTNEAASVTYHLKLTNNCAGKADFAMYASMPPTKNYVWHWKFGNGRWGQEVIKRDLSGTGRASLTVNRPLGNIPNGKYSPITVYASMDGNRSVMDTIKLSYYVSN